MSSRSAAILEAIERRRHEARLEFSGGAAGAADSSRDRVPFERPTYNFRERRTFNHLNLNKAPEEGDPGPSLSSDIGSGRYTPDRGGYLDRLDRTTGYGSDRVGSSLYPESGATSYLDRYRERIANGFYRNQPPSHVGGTSQFAVTTRRAPDDYSDIFLDDGELFSRRGGAGSTSDDVTETVSETGDYNGNDEANGLQYETSSGHSGDYRSPVTKNFSDKFRQSPVREKTSKMTEDDDVIYYELFDNYTIVHLEAVEDGGASGGNQSQPMSPTPSTSRRPSLTSALGVSPLALLGQSSGLPDFSKGPWAAGVNLPVHKKRNLIKNLEVMIEELQQRVNKIQEEVNVEDVASMRYPLSPSLQKTGDDLLKGGSGKQSCGSTCQHAEELKHLKQQHEKLTTERVLLSEEQNVHRTDAEKCASKLETENLQLTERLKQAESQIRDMKRGRGVREGEESKQGLLLQIQDARRMAQTLPQQCDVIRQDCNKLQAWMIAEINQIKELLSNPTQISAAMLKQNTSKSAGPLRSSVRSTDAQPTPNKPRIPDTNKNPPTVSTTKKVPEAAAKPRPPSSSGFRPPVPSKPAKPIKQTSSESSASKSTSRPPPSATETESSESKSKNITRENSESNGQNISRENSESSDKNFSRENSVDWDRNAGSTVVMNDILTAITKLAVEAGGEATSVDLGDSDDLRSERSSSEHDPINGDSLTRTSQKGFTTDTRDNISVLCRLRPIVKEDADNHAAQLQLDPNKEGIIHATYRGRLKTFDVNRIVNSSATQEQIFNEARSTVLSCLDGTNVCLFAYGHTGAGKTYTLQGSSSDTGLVQRSFDCLIGLLEAFSDEWQYSVTIGVVELFNDTFRDLLTAEDGGKVDVKQHADGSISIPTLKRAQLRSTTDLEQVLAQSQINRTKGIGKSSGHFAHSHLLMLFTIHREKQGDRSKTITNKLSFIDLAGSERVDKTAVEPARYKEAQNINKTLTCVSDVICTLRARAAHVPIRTSRLTHLLQDSLASHNVKVLLLVLLSSSEKHVSETISSLTLAQRVQSSEPTGTRTPVRPVEFSAEALAVHNAARGTEHSSRRSSISSERAPMVGVSGASGGARRPSAQTERNASATRERKLSGAGSSGSVLDDLPPVARPVKPTFTPGRSAENKSKNGVANTPTTANRVPYPKAPRKN